MENENVLDKTRINIINMFFILNVLYFAMSLIRPNIIDTSIFITSVIMFLLRKHKSQIIISIIVFEILLYSIYAGIRWSTLLPSFVFSIFLINMLSTVLLHKFTKIFVMIVSILSIFGIFYLNTNNIFVSDISWINRKMEIDDAIEHAMSVAFVIFTVWYLKDKLFSVYSQLLLVNHNLELTIKDKVNEIREKDIEKINYLNKLADFGKISSGLVHDLLKPVQNIIVSNSPKNSVESIKIIKDIQKMMEVSRHKILMDKGLETFNIKNEISLVAKHLRNQNIFIDVENKINFSISADKIIFNHILINIINNALEAMIHLENKMIKIKTSFIKDIFTIDIYNNGPKIAEKDIPSLFLSGFTTKENGLGYGLSSIKYYLENNFNNGSVKFKNVLNGEYNVCFTLLFPIANKKVNKINSKYL